ncbi:phosphate-binding protein [Dissulfurispira thermophila]|uniref:Phosphate-binding protein n=2 Tax=root TaxID=1 RepID=A0A7G1H0W8_9BACT|nr:substrate-binding domain-containing protein [Dissulfurispira thermophila]BCB96445.1 phosphate-binding protein [Dissulfurispira thermophila]
MKRYGLVLATVVVFLLSLSIGAFAEEIKIGAGAAPTENVLKPIKEHFEKTTGIKLQIIASGPKIALQDLEKGAVDAAAAGLTFDDWMNLMKKEGAEVKDPASLQQFTIGKDKIIVLIHKDNPVSKLSKEQLKGIFTGKITNWKDVGGKDMPIIVVWGKLIPGTNKLFVKNILDGESQTKDVLEATTAEDVRQNVASNPEAIGIGPVAVVNATVKSPETPGVSRPIILVTKGKPSANVQKLIDFIKGEGQKYIRQ